MKVLTFDQSKCDGCGVCQAMCSLAKTGEVRPSEACIRLKRAETQSPVCAETQNRACAEPAADSESACAAGTICATGEMSALRAVYCQQCAEPVCVTACMRGIISKGEDGLVVRKTEDCFRCAACAVMCPVGAPVFEHKANAFVTCDLCGGDPVCAKVCPTGAIRYEEVEETIAAKRDAYAQMAMREEAMHR